VCLFLCVRNPLAAMGLATKTVNYSDSYDPKKWKSSKMNILIMNVQVSLVTSMFASETWLGLLGLYEITCLDD